MSFEHSSQLAEVGWDASFAESLASLGDPSLEPGRVGADHGSEFLVYTSVGPERALLESSLRASKRVAVGDWVGLRRTRDSLAICGVLDRRTTITRKAPNVEVVVQVLAANVDVVFIVTSLDADFNPRRIERLLTVVYQSGASPVVLLNKADLRSGEGPLATVQAIAPGVPTHVLSAFTGVGVDAVTGHLGAGKTAVLIGSSGVGKSTLINRLMGADLQRTFDVHRSGQGRHVTSHRELFALPGGGVVIDTPGLREIQLWAGDDALDQVFGDIVEMARGCRFADCQHRSEPGCAVKAALAEGALDRGRWASYRKLEKELRSIEVRADARLQMEETRRWKLLARESRARARP